MNLVFQCLFLSMLVVQLYSGPVFSRFKSLEVDKNVTQIVFYPDLTKMIAYTPRYVLVNRFVGYSYTAFEEDQTLMTNPAFIAASIDSQGRNNIICGSAQGAIKQRIYLGTTWLERDIIYISQDGGVKYIEVSTDGDYFVTYGVKGQQVYIQSLEHITQPYKLIDYKDKGVVNAAKWIPNTHQIVICGGNSSNNKYFEIYDLQKQTKRDLAHVTLSTVVDLAIAPDGKTIYFFQSAANTQEHRNLEHNADSAWLFALDLATQETSAIQVLTNYTLTRVNIKGNFLEVSDSGGIVQIYNIKGTGWHGSYPSVLKGYGLSPDGSDLVTLDPQDSFKLVVYKLCMGFSDYFSSQDNTCKSCAPSCLHCFFKADHCSECRQSYYLVEWSCEQCLVPGCLKCQNGSYCTQCNFTKHYVVTKDGGCQCTQGYYQQAAECLSCMPGCVMCTSGNSCQKCSQNWVLDNLTCLCPETRLKVGNTCYRCEEYMQQCITCTDIDLCLTCKEGYELDPDTHKCVEQSDDNKMIIIIVAVVVPVVLVGGFLLQRYFRKRRERRVSEILASEQSEPYRRSDV